MEVVAVTRTGSKEVDFNFAARHLVRASQRINSPFWGWSLCFISLEIEAKLQSCYSSCHPSPEVLQILWRQNLKAIDGKQMLGHNENKELSKEFHFLLEKKGGKRDR